MSWGEGSMNWAELRDLVDALPEDSATKAATAGDIEGRRWTQDTYAIAATYNALLMLIRIQWAAQLKGQPPDMTTITPPRMEADELAEEQAVIADAHARQVLDRWSPTALPDQARQADLDEWQQKIRDLEAAQQH